MASQALDQLPPIERDDVGPLRVPVVTKWKDMGSLYIVGKVESGTLYKDQDLLLMPNNKRVRVFVLKPRR